MFIAYIIIAAMLALVLLASAAAKLRHDPRVTRSIHNILIAMNRMGLLDHSALSAQASPSTSAHRAQEVDTVTYTGRRRDTKLGNRCSLP